MQRKKTIKKTISSLLINKVMKTISYSKKVTMLISAKKNKRLSMSKSFSNSNNNM